MQEDRLGSVGKFYPYGEGRVGDPKRFATYERDEGGLDYAVNRYYWVGMGRFMSADPYMASGGVEEPGSWNRYTYTRGDPVGRFDPTGLEDCVPQFGSLFCEQTRVQAPVIPRIIETVNLADQIRYQHSTFTVSLPTITVFNDFEEAGRSMPAILRIAEEFLQKPRCRELFGTTESRVGEFAPEKLLHAVYGNVGALAFLPANIVGGVAVSSGFTFGWLIDGSAAATASSWFAVGASGIAPGGPRVWINVGAWNSATRSGLLPELAGILLHELGHVFNALRSRGSGGSLITDDVGSDAASDSNVLLIIERCIR